jgi:hypothetical protein
MALEAVLLQDGLNVFGEIDFGFGAGQPGACAGDSGDGANESFHKRNSQSFGSPGRGGRTMPFAVPIRHAVAFGESAYASRLSFSNPV